MTVETTNSTISYTGNNSVTTFAYNFLTYSEDHLFIYLDDVEQTSGFSAEGIGDDSGGDIIFNVAPGNGVEIRIDRTVPETQLIEYQEYGPFKAKTNERGLDLGVMIGQQNARDTERNSSKKMDKQPLSTENNIIIFDDEGNSKDSGFAIYDIDGFTPVEQPRQAGDNIETQFNTPSDIASSPFEFQVRVNGLRMRGQTDYTTSTIGKIDFVIAPANLSEIDITWYKPLLGADAVIIQEEVNELLISDLSQAYEFATVADYKSFTTEFPVGKVIQLQDRGAEFLVISGTGAANEFDIIANTNTSQSAQINPKNGQVSVEQVGDFVAACEYASTNNLKCILESDISIAGLKGNASLVTVSGYFDFDTQGNTITDTTVYSDGEIGVLFTCNNCDPLIVKANTVSQTAIDTGGFIEDVGWVVVQPKEGCNNVDITLRTQGGFGGVIPQRASSDPDSFKVKNINCDIKSTNTHYPYNAQFSGDNADIKIEANTCGRNYFIYGCDNVDIVCTSKNAQKTSFVSAFEGKGCSNVTVKDVDVDSTDGQPAANHTTLRFGDGTPAVMRNIEFTFNLVNPANGWGNSFEISKYFGGSPDAVGRGHVLDGVRITGTIDNTASGSVPIKTDGTFTQVDTGSGADFIDHFDFEYLKAIGGTSTLDLTALANSSSFKNTNAGVNNFYVLTNNTSKTTFENVVCANITGNINSDDCHIYTGCTISDASTQNISDNKTIIDCDIDDTERTVLKQTNIGLYTAQASTVVEGDLSGVTNVFKIKPVGGGYKVRIKYFLVNNQADTNPVTRDETIGIKVLTGTMNSSGTWLNQIPVTDEVTELTLGTPTVLNVSLVSGDATGGFIAIDAPSYTQANSRAVLQLEVMSYLPVTIVPA